MSRAPLERHVSTWDATDLRWFLAHRPEESDRLDYKQVTDPTNPETRPFSTPRQRKEIAKDVTSFANTSGGRIIIGMAEDKVSGRNVPVGFDQIPLADAGAPDRILSSIHALCRPPLSLKPKRIDLDDDAGYCLALEIPESMTPVMLQGTGENRYYWRQDWNSVPMTEQQVRERYERMQTARQAVEAMTSDAETEPNVTFPRLKCAWFTLLVVPALGPVPLFDPTDTRVPIDLEALSRDPTNSGFRWLYQRLPTHFGFEYASYVIPDQTRIRLRLHRTGLVEVHLPQWADMQSRADIDACELGANLIDGLLVARGLYETEGYVSDVVIQINANRLAGWSVSGKPLLAPRGISLADRSSVPDLSSDALPLTQRFLNRTWNAAGLVRCSLPDHWLDDVHAVFGTMG